VDNIVIDLYDLECHGLFDGVLDYPRNERTSELVTQRAPALCYLALIPCLLDVILTGSEWRAVLSKCVEGVGDTAIVLFAQRYQVHQNTD